MTTTATWGFTAKLCVCILRFVDAYFAAEEEVRSAVCGGHSGAFRKRMFVNLGRDGPRVVADEETIHKFTANTIEKKDRPRRIVSGSLLLCICRGGDVAARHSPGYIRTSGWEYCAKLRRWLYGGLLSEGTAHTGPVQVA